jgi:hypothetical protein
MKPDGQQAQAERSASRPRKRPQAKDYRHLLGPLRLLNTPLEVEEALEREVEYMAAQGRPLVGPARERVFEDLKLRYYFGGQRIAYRQTDQGKEILAVGSKDMRRLFRTLTPEEDEAVTSGFAEPW